jgi:Holliday junction resolvase
MAMTPEAKVKKRVVELLKQHDVYYFYPVTGGFGRSGVPDIVCCKQGRFFAVECKAGRNKPTALQELEIQKIRQAGGFAFVINEDNLDLLETFLLEFR